ncbi:hypothetical protein CO2235_MP10373 [Cupriavidus oxalaticus]|uniref:Uncharacterized protein n=1 Tax=Cupriavidus oxalaticus TaxID=96344 RepID=A0A375G9Z1_9BURK|nr:hypothetical protein CO2235_MP10373 [Cupriavidus oxalaticus]
MKSTSAKQSRKARSNPSRLANGRSGAVTEMTATDSNRGSLSATPLDTANTWRVPSFGGRYSLSMASFS